MYSTDSEILEIVDSHDKVIGTGTRGEIHRMGFFHRAVHMFVFNPAGQVYIQRRSRSKDRHPGKLDSSAAGHVDPGETYEETAIRELQEELGIQSGSQRNSESSHVRANRQRACGPVRGSDQNPSPFPIRRRSNGAHSWAVNV